MRVDKQKKTFKKIISTLILCVCIVATLDTTARSSFTRRTQSTITSLNYTDDENIIKIH